jgi:hypothetical protein
MWAAIIKVTTCEGAVDGRQSPAVIGVQLPLDGSLVLTDSNIRVSLLRVPDLGLLQRRLNEHVTRVK